MNAAQPVLAPAESPLPAPVSSLSPHWTTAHRVAFRFAFIYWPLYFMTNAVAPFLEDLGQKYEQLVWHRLVPWVGARLLGLGEIATQTTGSGDRTYDYVQLLCFFTIATTATGIWSLGARRAEYTRLDTGLRLIVRFMLASALVSYGMIKVIKLQMPTPSSLRLTQDLGDFSPMGLLWTFLGASTAYEMFAGAAEVLAGVLLLFRRTALLGALVAAGVMANVVAMNFCYDVPVKLYSSHLFLAAIFLTLPDVRRLADFFLFHRPVAPRAPAPAGPRWVRVARRVVHLAVVAAVLGMNLKGALEARKTYGEAAPTPPLHGLYDVEGMWLNGIERPPLVTDAVRWHKMAVTRFGLVFRKMDGKSEAYRVKVDEAARTITLTTRGAEKPAYVLRYTRDDTHLEISGALPLGMVRARMRAQQTDEYLLVNRGFHWVNEVPFNR